MIPVYFGFEVGHTLGCLGFSYLQTPPFGGVPERTTTVFLRDNEGWCHSCLSFPAETFRGKL